MWFVRYNIAEYPAKLRLLSWACDLGDLVMLNVSGDHVYASRDQLDEFRAVNELIEYVGIEHALEALSHRFTGILYCPQGTLLSEDKIAVQSCSRLSERLPASHAKTRLAPICREFFLSPPACP